MGSTPAGADFDLVMLGTDIGTYALARAFHERYGVRSTVISRVIGGPIKNSRIIDTVDLGEDAQRADTLAALEREGRRRKEAGRTTILLHNADSFARMVTDNHEWLSQWYVMPEVRKDVLDLIADKIEFGRVCTELGIPVPRTLVQDFSGADADDWEPDDVDLDYPLVAKPAVGAAYEHLVFEGKKKIYKVDSPEHLRQILATVRAAGFRDRFVLQELIPGDDTAMRSITAYVDRSGEVALLATARVLLQEHTPLALGNPAAMITTPYPELMEQAERLLKHVGYRGFANFDVKVDPRDGVMKFFEMNPRIGRNNFYVTAAGANVADFVVADLIENRRTEQVVVRNEILYTVLPVPLIRRYLDPELRTLLKKVAARGVHHPLRYPDTMWRRGYVALALANQVKKYRDHYPKATDTGF